MSIWTDTAVKELQEKVAWLEKHLEQLQQAVIQLQQEAIDTNNRDLTKAANGTLHLKRK